MLCHFFILLYALGFIISISTCCYGDMGENKVLIVGEELWKETLKLQMGSRMYQLQGLKSRTWYEVKISYPASIPASFSIQLKKERSDLGINRNRKLLNTEKLIFKTHSDGSNQSKLYVLVTVEPEGFVAIRHVPERQDIIFNIVCDELLLGIPHKAWWVAILVMLCLGLAIIIPRFLPSYLLLRNGSPQLLNQNFSKEY
ncbi:uncharacterized protein LOC107262298 [Ricinus communis]|uniref:uncharacterized protein LOC107262298 n=1 Tax=Ricinus communis TaxID=3988 RepID=UPI000772CEA1|nr:uncharacterized protein LOC107262298 [Ricinus communis]XP_015582803.1 uncharacterized protein LOC107262298 [Ricinus communis]|eukprot:XP_015582802.1 uncharacterized protein LOC107262298 [Ricinus communis]